VPDDSPPSVPRSRGEFSCAATAVTEAENATRESGIGKSQGGACCTAVSLVPKGFAWSACPAEESVNMMGFRPGRLLVDQINARGPIAANTGITYRF
jgi:hypothetical protein